MRARQLSPPPRRRLRRHLPPRPIKRTDRHASSRKRNAPLNLPRQHHDGKQRTRRHPTHLRDRQALPQQENLLPHRRRASRRQNPRRRERDECGFDVHLRAQDLRAEWHRGVLCAATAAGEDRSDYFWGWAGEGTAVRYVGAAVDHWVWGGGEVVWGGDGGELMTFIFSERDGSVVVVVCVCVDLG